MNRSALLLAGFLLASGAHADWLLNEYATDAPDSTTANTLYGVQSFGNPSSITNVTIKDSTVILDASRIASEGTEGYSARVGLFHPLDSIWNEYDLTGLTSITFEFRNSTRITDYLSVSFGSSVYSDSAAKAGTVYEVALKGTKNLPASTTFKDASVDILDFALPTWWTAPDDFPTLETVLKRVNSLQFSPKTLYSAAGTQNGKTCDRCVAPDMTSQTLEIRNIVLVGVNDPTHPPPPQVFGCIGDSLVLDARFDDNQNEAGGYWFNFSDFDSTLTSTDKTKGSSTSKMLTTPGDTNNSGFITLTAGLNKMGVGGTVWHDYAGWAGVGTRFEGESTLNDPRLSGISFFVRATKLDPTVKYLIFKVATEGVPDTAIHQVALPAATVTAADGYNFCIRPEDLMQASFVKDKVDLDVTKIKQLSWEARITDNKSSSIFKADAEFLVADVKLWGLSGGGTRLGARIAKSAFSASYANGFLSLKGVQGIKSMDVITLDGRKVASFAPASRVHLELSRGTYFLSCKRDGAPLIRSFAVVGR